MGLEEYRDKRDFGRTASLPGWSIRSARRAPATMPARRAPIVIHKHAASRLHYDLRLELDGVLKSWAIPERAQSRPARPPPGGARRGPPSRVRRLRGRHPQGRVRRRHGDDLGPGHVGAVGQAQSARGLREGRPQVHPARREAARLVRAGAHGPSLGGERRRKQGELAADQAQGRGRRVRARATRPCSSSPRAPPPVAPWRRSPRKAACGTRDGSGRRSGPACRARAWRRFRDADRAAAGDAGEAAARGEQWLHEIKFDGYRMLCSVAGGEARLFTRRGLDWTERFAQRGARGGASCPRAKRGSTARWSPCSKRGASSFSALQQALSAGRDEQIVYYVFDLLFLDGYDLRPGAAGGAQVGAGGPAAGRRRPRRRPRRALQRALARRRERSLEQACESRARGRGQQARRSAAYGEPPRARLAEGEVPAAAGVRGRRLLRSRGRAHGLRRAAPGPLRRRRPAGVLPAASVPASIERTLARVCAACGRSSSCGGAVRGRAARRPGARRALGASGARRGGRVRRLDRRRHGPPLVVPGPARRQAGRVRSCVRSRPRQPGDDQADTSAEAARATTPRARRAARAATARRRRPASRRVAGVKISHPDDLLSRPGHHQARAGAILRARRRADHAAHRRSPADAGALPRRSTNAVLLPEARRRRASPRPFAV